jgi:RNA polymerase sigma factor (sigma-70 family)
MGSIRLLFEVGTVAGLSDGQLLGRFLDRRADVEAAEVAFAALVERHGPMVLRACRARLVDEHDAQDAFQATFLILARKAGSIRNRDSASSWLQGVARRVSSCARRQAALRRAKERTAAGQTAEAVADADRDDLVPAVREEVGELPEKYRTPLMLCLLDGLTHEEAATHLGWPVGTVKTRVRHAKDRLRIRLARRGLAPSLAAIGAALATREASAMPAALVRATARTALRFEMGRSMASLSASVARLVEVGLGSLIMSRWKVVALVIMSAGALTAGAKGLARQAPGPRGEDKPAVARPAAKDAAAGTEPVKAEVTGQEALDQLEMARLRFEILQKNLDKFKREVIQMMETLDAHKARLEGIRSAKSRGELERLGIVQKNEDLDVARKRFGDWLSGLTPNREADLKRSFAGYAEMKRKLAQEEQRVKDLEGRATQANPAGSSPSPKGSAEAERIAQADLLDRLKVDNIKVDVLRMDVDRWRARMEALHQKLWDIRDQARQFRRQKGMAEDEYNQAANRIDQEQHHAERDLADAQASYLTLSRQVVEGERHLRELAKDLPPSAQADFFRSSADPQRAGEAKPTAEVDRRLSDVERKLDLILKALENQGREAGKK